METAGAPEPFGYFDIGQHGAIRRRTWVGYPSMADSCACCGTLCHELINDVNGLPDQGGYGELTDAFLALAEKHLTYGLGNLLNRVIPMSQWDTAGRRESRRSQRSSRNCGSLDRLGARHHLGPMDRDLRNDYWNGRPMPWTPSHDGVQVLDAMAARGLSFRALFIIGMNEKVFPRFIHEDGFLRDRHRLILSETLGYKIDQKLQGYAEEALLFELLRSSATERLYLSYQRADTAGRPLAPSTYLDTMGALARQPNPEAVFALPRRWPDRAGLALFTPPLLTREELTVSTVLQGRT